MEQTVYLGAESRTGLERLFQTKNWERVFIVTGKKSFETSGAKEYVLNNIPLNTTLLRFSEFENNPNIRDLLNGLDIATAFMPDVIISIGGGSVIDMGKLIRFFLTNDGNILSNEYNPKRHVHIPLIAIPTTAGTGSEATHFAVLYDELKEKHSIANNAILPDYAILNSALTYNQSPYLTACAGFDALAQAIEAYWNKNATAESDEYAEKAIDLIYDTLPRVVKDPTPELRDKLAIGAYWAGRAINITKTTAPHAFSYPFTSHYGIPHGHAVAIVFPAIAEYNLINGVISPRKAKIIKKVFDPDRFSISSMIAYIDNIGLGVPKILYDPDILLEGISLERLANNPIEISFENAKLLLLKSIGDPPML